MIARLICRIRGHRLRFGLFDHAILAHDLVCTRCDFVATARQISDELDAL